MIKTEELNGIDEDKILEQTIAVTEHDDEIEEVGSVAEEVTVSLVDEFVDTSIVET